MRRIPELDALRAFAAALILIFHLDARPQSPIYWGWIGVDLFFVLSGFLITGILLDEHGKPHYFRNFYARLALRIFPLYFGVLIALFAHELLQFLYFRPQNFIGRTCAVEPVVDVIGFCIVTLTYVNIGES